MTLSTSLYNSDNPIVSICCATYNQEKYIADALDGFLMQKTNFPVEILVNDDCSTDNTPNIVREYQKQFPEIIKPIFQTENQYSKGKKPISQILLPRCNGKYIALCEGDDFWTDPYKLQKQVEFLEKDLHYSMCFTNYSNANEEGQIKRKFAVRKHKRDLNYLEILEYYTPRTLTVLFRTQLIQNKIPKEVSYVPNGDTFLFSLIAKNGIAGYLDIVSGCQRFNKDSVYSSKPFQIQNEMLIKTLTILQDYFTAPEEQKAIRAHLSRKQIHRATYMFKKGAYIKSALAFIHSLKISKKPYYDRFSVKSKNLL